MIKFHQSSAISLVLEYLSPQKTLKLQQLSKRFYNSLVPRALQLIQFTSNHILLPQAPGICRLLNLQTNTFSPELLTLKAPKRQGKVLFVLNLQKCYALVSSLSEKYQQVISVTLCSYSQIQLCTASVIVKSLKTPQCAAASTVSDMVYVVQDKTLITFDFRGRKSGKQANIKQRTLPKYFYQIALMNNAKTMYCITNLEDYVTTSKALKFHKLEDMDGIESWKDYPIKVITLPLSIPYFYFHLYATLKISDRSLVFFFETKQSPNMMVEVKESEEKGPQIGFIKHLSTQQHRILEPITFNIGLHYQIAGGENIYAVVNHQAKQPNGSHTVVLKYSKDERNDNELDFELVQFPK
ncbi:hypothetical protein FGO68_gene4430 [Halteria grandinella]|uniref:F-box domain-containing protein n=1 Tax=Halteria grandinella TaxID=5974 RepID=A0A8J8T8B2_HALGN|nr:hypothetical protein FGO68_gene4430 [Halteria grandinella]